MDSWTGMDMVDDQRIDAQVAVTGASGHIGYWVARALLARGARLLLPVRRINRSVEQLRLGGARVELVDLHDRSACARTLSGVDCLFHLAAENTTDTSQADRVRHNTQGLTEAIMTAAAEARVGTVVYTSSAVVIGRSADPMRLLTEEDRSETSESPYVAGKKDADTTAHNIAAKAGIDLRRVYPSWVMGPGDLRGTAPQRLVAGFLNKGQPFHLPGGVSIAHVCHVAEAHVAAWLRGAPGQDYLLGGDNISFEQLFGILARLGGWRGPVLGLPRSFVIAASSVLSVLLRPLGKAPPLEPGYARAMIGRFSWYDSTRALDELGYHIPPARETLADAFQWERQRARSCHVLGLPTTRPGPAITEPATQPAPLLVTGVPGWLGNRLVDVLVAGLAGHRPERRRQVRLLVEPCHEGLLTGLPDNFSIHLGDILDPEAVARALEGVGTVYHLAGVIYPSRIRTLYEVNAKGTRNLVDRCIEAGVRRILYMSTDSLCGHGTPSQPIFDETTPSRPFRHYGLSKAMAEDYLMKMTAEGSIDGTALRGFWFFGPHAPPRQRRFLAMMKGHRQVIFGDGKNLRSISHVDNVIAAFMAAEDEPRTYGRWYWIGDEKANYSIDQIHGILCAQAGSTYNPHRLPGSICTLMLGLDSLMGLFGRLSPTIHGVAKFRFDIAGRIDAAQRDFGYCPVKSLDSCMAYQSDDEEPLT